MASAAAAFFINMSREIDSSCSIWQSLRAELALVFLRKDLLVVMQRLCEFEVRLQRCCAGEHFSHTNNTFADREVFRCCSESISTSKVVQKKRIEGNEEEKFIYPSFSLVARCTTPMSLARKSLGYARPWAMQWKLLDTNE